ncbi:hypothetical protein DL96DRAFT_1631683 [Flagelloscypha sp. PMI_526]|nr:hypothetical protein DL96DRAFT_1631683 [Flagelloscypha sp. PMI_526]
MHPPSCLPLELEKLVFEMAAWAYRKPTCLRLILVAHRVCNWITPILYHTLTLHSAEVIDIPLIQMSLTSCCSSPRTRTHLQHIRVLSIQPTIHQNISSLRNLFENAQRITFLSFSSLLTFDAPIWPSVVSLLPQLIGLSVHWSGDTQDVFPHLDQIIHPKALKTLRILRIWGAITPAKVSIEGLAELRWLIYHIPNKDRIVVREQLAFLSEEGTNLSGVIITSNARDVESWYDGGPHKVVFLKVENLSSGWIELAEGRPGGLVERATKVLTSRKCGP